MPIEVWTNISIYWLKVSTFFPGLLFPGPFFTRSRHAEDESPSTCNRDHGEPLVGRSGEEQTCGGSSFGGHEERWWRVSSERGPQTRWADWRMQSCASPMVRLWVRVCPSEPAEPSAFSRTDSDVGTRPATRRHHHPLGLGHGIHHDPPNVFPVLGKAP